MREQAPDAVARLEALEILVAHQERTIGELNEAITEHWRKIAALERLVVQLRNEVQNISPPRDAPEPPPPHY